MVTFGKTISLFLIEGDPNSRWVCELSNWNGKAYKIPRIKVHGCFDRPDLAAFGIYFLFGKNDIDEKSIVYIGESENVYNRLLQHDSPTGKDFWNECIVFISKDNRLNKAHIKYLEHKCYFLAKEADRYSVENPTVPADASLTEAEQAEMDEFLYNIRLINNVLGHKVLEPIAVINSDNNAEADTPKLCIHAARGADAEGQQTSEGFVVLKGSKVASTVTRSCPNYVIELRKKLIDTNVINSEWVFTENKIFGSPSTAAAVVMGRSANGLTEWRPNPSE